MNQTHTPTLLARAEANRRAGHKKDARADYEAALKTMDEDDPNRQRRGRAPRLAAARHRRLRRCGRGPARHRARRRARTRRSTPSSARSTSRRSGSSSRSSCSPRRSSSTRKDPAIYNALALLALRQGKAQEAFERFDQAVVARRQLHRRALQQGDRAARRRRLRASQGRARGDRRKATRRLRGAGLARRRPPRPQGVPRGQEGRGSA